MNIFDWHEDKTPEELAKELGISDLAVIENAGKEVVETLDPKNEENAGSLSQEDIENLDLWTNDFQLKDLKEDMTFQVIDIKTIGHIMSLDKRKTVYVKKVWSKNIFPWGFDEFQKKCLLLKKDIENYIDWTDDFSIEHLKVWTKLRKKNTGNTGVIKEISDHAEPRIRIKMDGVPNKIRIDSQKFLDTCSINKKEKLETFIGLSLKEIEWPNWKLLYEIPELGVWIGIRILNLKDKKVWKIINIDIDTNIITTKMENGIAIYIDTEDFKWSYGIYKEDLLDFQPINHNYITNPGDWSSISKDISELQRGARLNSISNNKNIFYILDIDDDLITIVNRKKTKILYSSLKELSKLFLIYDSDIKIF